MVERPPTTTQKQTSTIFLLTAVILVTSLLTVVVTAPQQAEAKQFKYCHDATYTVFTGEQFEQFNTTSCYLTGDDCESSRQIYLNSGRYDTVSPCYKTDQKYKFDK